MENMPKNANCNPEAAGSFSRGTCDGITNAINIVLKALPAPIITATIRATEW